MSGKGSGQISITGLVCASPDSAVGLNYRTKVPCGRKGERRSFAETDYATLLDAAHQQLGNPIVLIWDNPNTHAAPHGTGFT